MHPADLNTAYTIIDGILVAKQYSLSEAEVRDAVFNAHRARAEEIKRWVASRFKWKDYRRNWRMQEWYEDAVKIIDAKRKE